jgi:sirohydrochlorin cobaltochelatase
MKRGLILFAHGARDPRWAEPFERLHDRTRKLRPGLATRLAYLELMKPDLAGAAAELVAEGCSEIRVVPVFLGQGGHVREDLPEIAKGLAERYPSVQFSFLPPAGEDDAVLDALASFSVTGM